MINNDYHIHSSFSPDCQYSMEETIQSALQLNIDNLCFTDHHDPEFPSDDITFLVDFDNYFERINHFRSIYNGQINIRAGIEFGIQKHIYSTLNEIAEKYPFDFILCSSHLANGIDPYLPEYFINKNKQDAYNEYFSEILHHIKNYDAFDSYGHLDYVARYGPYTDKTYKYSDHSDLLDELLKAIIDKGKGIEINTSGFLRFKDNPHPRIEVINRYRELGGEIITVGSDSHNPKNLLYQFDHAKAILQKAGFKYYTIFINRKPKFITLD